MPRDVHPRLLRAFTTAAEELHFGRAAARLFVAQQALSRDIRALEDQLGLTLFTRTTRRVELTAHGIRLLPAAQAALAAQDTFVSAAARGGEPLLVVLNSPGLTSGRVLAAARELAPEVEMLARFHSGLAAAAPKILDGGLDVAFGRVAGLDAKVREGLAHQVVRLEPLALLLPEDHPLAARRTVPLKELSGYAVDIGTGNPGTTEWTDLGAKLLARFGLGAAAPHTMPVGIEEMSLYLRRHREPVLAAVGAETIPGTVLRPLVEPVPLSVLSLVWRPGLRHPGLAALRTAAARLGETGGWLRRPAGCWLPAADLALLG